MPSVEPRELAVARIYAQAMLQLAQARDQVDALLAELLDFVALAERDAQFEMFLTSPDIDLGARRQTVEKLFRGRYSDLFVDSIQVLNRKDRLMLIHAVAEAYRNAHEELQGRVEVLVRSAAPLTEQARARLREVASMHTGREADLVETVDESLLGGLVLQIGDEKLDASLATKLKTLAASLLDRASREIHGGRSFLESAPG